MLITVSECRLLIYLCMASGAFLTRSAAAITYTFTPGDVIHEFAPEQIITIPGNPPSEFRVAPQATDTVHFDTTGNSFETSDTSTHLEFTLSAPEGFIFLADPGLLTYQFGFSLNISDDISDASFDSPTALFLGNSLSLPISFAGWRPTENGTVTTLPGLSTSSPSAVFMFTGLHVSTDLITSAPTGPFTLESASFSLFTRNLAINSDPGTALSLVPIPEPSPVISLLFTAAILVPRRRRVNQRPFHRLGRTDTKPDLAPLD